MIPRTILTEGPRHGGNEAECGSCKAPVIWVRTEKGKRMPLDRDPIAGGSYQIDEEGVARVNRSFQTGYISHFATCPNAKTWRKP